MAFFWQGVAIVGIAGVGFAACKRRYNHSVFPVIFGGTRLTLLSNEYLTVNSRVLTFGLPDGVERVGVSPGAHILTEVTTSSGKNVRRDYTPIYTDKEDKVLRLGVKQMHLGGASEALCNLKPGEQVKFKGTGLSDWRVKPDRLNSVNMVAGGSGIAPMYSILRYLMAEKPGSTVNLIYANHSADNVMFREELDKLQSQYPERLHVTYVTGRIQKPLLEKTLWKGTDSYVCGPDGMVRSLARLPRGGVINEVTNSRVIPFYS